MWNNFAKISGWIIGITIFVVWMNLVGNPHVIETSIGLVIATVAGVWIYLKLSGKQI